MQMTPTLLAHLLPRLPKAVSVLAEISTNAAELAALITIQPLATSVVVEVDLPLLPMA